MHLPKHFLDPLLLSFLWVSQEGQNELPSTKHHRQGSQNLDELIKRVLLNFGTKELTEEGPPFPIDKGVGL